MERFKGVEKDKDRETNRKKERMIERKRWR